jgi:hypothetical protein
MVWLLHIPQRLKITFAKPEKVSFKKTKARDPQYMVDRRALGSGPLAADYDEKISLSS